MVQATPGNLTDLERNLNLAIAPRGVADALPRAIAMTDMDRGADPAGLLAGLPGGGAIILRHREPSGLAALAQAAVPAARRAGHRVLIAGAPRLAYSLGADGIHLSEAMIRRHPGWALRRPRPDWLVTAAAHGGPALRRAASAGVDAVLLSPVLPTASHPERAALGILRFATLCRSVPVAVFALGGIGFGGLRRLKGSQCAGIAGIGLFSGA